MLEIDRTVVFDVLVRADRVRCDVFDDSRHDEIEHAAMILDWMRSNMDQWNHEPRDDVLTGEPIVEAEAKAHE